MSYEDNAIYGGLSMNTGLSAQTMNPTYATSSFDWGAILTNGIRGATEGAMAGLVAEKYASGQLVVPGAQQQVARANNMMPLLVVGVLAYVLMKGA
jgi:hypothetical protein